MGWSPFALALSHSLQARCVSSWCAIKALHRVISPPSPISRACPSGSHWRYLLSPPFGRCLHSSAARSCPGPPCGPGPTAGALLVHEGVLHPSASLCSSSSLPLTEHLSVRVLCLFGKASLGHPHGLCAPSSHAGLSSRARFMQVDNKLIRTGVVFQYWATGTASLPVVT